MVVPTSVTVIQIATTVAVVFAIVAVLRSAQERAAGRGGIPEAVGVTLFTWLAATAALAIAGVYRPTSGTAIPALPIAVIIGLGGAWAAAMAVPSLRGLIEQPAAQPSLVALNRRSSAVIWNVFGLLDLVVAIGLGATANPGPIQIFHPIPSTAVMTAFPMALVPTFLVPLSMVWHILSLRYLLSTRTASVGAVGAPGHLEHGR